MVDYEIETIARGDDTGTVAGGAVTASTDAVFRYKSLEDARAFFASERYQALVPLRERACDMTIPLFEEVDTGSS